VFGGDELTRFADAGEAGCCDEVPSSTMALPPTEWLSPRHAVARHSLNQGDYRGGNTEANVSKRRGE